MTIYTEKQTEQLSRVVYATRDSLEAARVDLADQYSKETTRIIHPPKKRIEIEAIYNEPKKNSSSKQRSIIIPEQYKNDVVVLVKSKEYEELIKNKEILEQISNDYDNIISAKRGVDEELRKQAEHTNEMVVNLNKLQSDVLKKDLLLIKHRIAIAALGALIVAGAFLRIKNII
jgi:hypothetical protein